MNFQVRRRKPQKVISESLSDLYPHPLQMYKVPPGNEITLTEFEDLALERLQLLRIVEQATHKGIKPYSLEWKQSIKADIKKEGLTHFNSLLKSGSNQTETDYQARRADHLSHFILRLTYCRSEELRRWFLARELELFKLRFSELGKSNIEQFLAINNLTYTPISSELKDELRNILYESTNSVNDMEGTNFYKVPFTEVCGLVRNRKVYVQNGFAFIPDFELVTCILSSFRALLSEALAYTNRRLPSLDDDRLSYLLTNLHTSYNGNDFTITENKDRINIANLDQYSRQHYPLCMQHIHEVFRSTHHLKYGCRMQYGLFLKGIGVTMEDSMTFWREEFTKIMDGNDFEKRYTYNIKHNYGKVGSMTDYAPYSCLKIIKGGVGPGEHHGCPFRHFDPSVLKQKMNEYGLSGQGMQDILELVKNSHYQIACSKYFEYSHGQPSKNVINHPNQYFEESMNFSKDDNGPNSTNKNRPPLSNVKVEEIWHEAE